MKKQREQKRSHLTYYFEVVDADSGVHVGNIADITVDGLMLLAKDVIDTGERKHLKIVSKEADFQSIEFESECRWCRVDVNPSYYDVGFHMDNISEDDRARIKDLINSSFFDD